MRDLPQAYLNRMERLLGTSFRAFLNSYEEAPQKGLRFNLKKARSETVKELVSAWHLKAVPECGAGYYYAENGPHAVRPGKSPYHDAGVFYIQEPSAMLPAEKAQIRQGERVLDLCAAPGGKSTQAAQNAGLLISNEYVKKRAQILSSNIERMGCSNVIVTSASAEALAQVFPLYFDCILVDAPCSGEGMMRRDEIAVTEWSEENVRLCAERQQEILSAAVQMLRPGGRLVYSTCTFEPMENGLQTEALLSRFAELRLLSEEQVFPHCAFGEGHYCAVFVRAGGTAAVRGDVLTDGAGADSAALLTGDAGSAGRTSAPASEKEAACASKECALELEFAAEHLRHARIPIVRCGVERGDYLVGKHRGEMRYEPSHAEALALSAEELSDWRADLLTEEAALCYLRGESLSLQELPETAYALYLLEEKNGKPETEMCGKKFGADAPEYAKKAFGAETLGYVKKASGAKRLGHAKKAFGAQISGAAPQRDRNGWKQGNLQAADSKKAARESGFIPVCFDGYPLGWGKLVGKTLKNHYPKGLRRLS